MDLRFTPEENAFREEVRSFLKEKMPEDIRKRMADGESMDKEDLVRWTRILAEKGWAVPHWPVEYGGTGWGPMKQYIFLEETQKWPAPQPLAFGVNMVGPVIYTFGSEAQKKKYLPRIVGLTDWWCQGFSEPGSGSDLASLKTRAVKEGDHYIVNGQKTWTSYAHYADWIFCLVRTDPTVEKRQEGISFLLIDMKSPGITVRPLILMDGAHAVNEVFFDDVSVPVENLVHKENQGWTVAKYLLGYERMNTGRIGESKRELRKIKELNNEKTRDFRFRDRLTRVEVELMALEITNLRFLDRMRRTGQPPGADVSMLKIKGTEIQQALTELMMQAAGPFAQAFRPVDTDADFDRFTAALAPRYCNLRKATIYAGSNEIQRNIISKMTLGL
jgi:alkylation response protein AidB-like acyl-CoA dehydrogenase